MAQLIKQRRRNRQKVATGQFNDLFNVAEAGPHHLRFVVVGLEVVEDLGYGDHTGIFWTWIAVTAAALFVPIEDPPHEWRDKGDAGLRAGDGLGKPEEECEVAVDTFPFQLFSCADTFPGGGHLDQYPVVADAGLVVKANEFAALGDRCFGVVAEASVNFGGNAARHDFEDLLAEGDADFIEGFAHHRIGAGIGTHHLARLLQGEINQILVGGDLGCRQDQRGVGGRVAGRELLDRVDVTGVGHHHSHGGELIEQVGHLLEEGG